MWRWICLPAWLPALLCAQGSSVLMHATEWERAGGIRYLNDQIPQGCELKLSVKLEKRSLYQLYHSGAVVEGQQAALLYVNNHILLSHSLNPTAQFETGMQLLQGASYRWLIPENSGTYILCRIADSAGIRTYIPVNGQARFSGDMKRYSGQDSHAKARVFLPDPLSRKGFLYGGQYRDRNDSNAGWLDSQMVAVVVPCRFESDTFRLVNDFISFADVSPPLTAHALCRDSFYFSRDQDAFEEVNIFYHITSLQEWWSALGFEDYRDTVLLDAHALFGTDESAFDPTAEPPTIEFGDGGVDDGEDADAPVHEYTHAAFDHLVPGGYNGTERKSIEEGICDFMAVAYSAKHTAHQTGYVYNWDGHNEFWEGRNLNNARVFPQDITSQPHIDGQLFGAALMDLAATTGYDSALRIVMQAMPLMVAGMGMQTCARLLLQTDSLINDGRTSWDIIKAFYPRGLLPGLGTEDMAGAEIPLKNSLEFALGYGPLQLFSSHGGRYEVRDITGRTVEILELKAGDKVQIFPVNYVPGCYYILSGTAAVKFIRF